MTQDNEMFERETLYGEQKKNWKFAGPLFLPIYIERPDEPKEFEENRGGMRDITATAIISRKLFEDSIPEEIANKLIAVRGSLIPNAGDVIAAWTTHSGDVAFWDVESLERDAYLGDLPLHLQWRMNIQRRSRFEAERMFGTDYHEGVPFVIIDAEDFDYHERDPKPRPETPTEGKIYKEPPKEPELHKTLPLPPRQKGIRNESEYRLLYGEPVR